MLNIIQQRYLLMEKLGQGGMGTVYRAKDRLTGEIIALKQVNMFTDDKAAGTDDSSTDYWSALAAEFRTLAGLRHPHIVSVLDYGFDDARQPYFTMQFLDYPRTITEAAADQPIGEQVRLLVEMLQALSYLHRRGVIHRDLKPDNVLVTQSGQVKVVDFGLAVQTSVQSFQDVGGKMAGTIAYMAPELFAEEEATIRSDLYAVGMIAYEIFSGRYPFNQKNAMLLINGILNEIPSTAEFDYDLADLLDKLLAKNPNERPGHADQVIQALCQATHQPAPVESITIRESFLKSSTFVGREAEVAKLKAALDSVQGAESEEAQFYLIGGESGVGKSRLIEELRIRALIKGFLVLNGQATAESSLWFELWREPVRRLAISTGLSDIEGGILKKMVPDIAQLLDREVPDVQDLGGSEDQQRLIFTLMDLFIRQQQPVLLIMEDLHWAMESLDPLKQMIKSRGHIPHWLVVGTYRNDEAPQLPEALPGDQIITVPRLNDDLMSQLSISMLGEAGKKEQILNFLKQETEGNVFFLVEVLRALAEEAGSLADVSSMSLPKSLFIGGIQQIIKRRLSQVPDWCQTRLALAAVAGRELDLRILQQALPDGSEPDSSENRMDMNTFLSICADCAVLEVQNNRWRFSHDKLRETILTDLPESLRQDLHGQVAAAIEQSYGDSRRSEAINDLAYHYYAARTWQKALVCSQEAGELAQTLYAPRVALEHYDHALEAAAQLGLRLPLLYRARGQIHEQLGNFEAALQDYEETRVLAIADGDLRGQWQALLDLGFLWTGQDFGRAGDYLQNSIELARQLDDPIALANSLNRVGNWYANQERIEEGLRCHFEALSIFESLSDKHGRARTLDLLGVTNLMLGDVMSSTKYYQEAVDLLRQLEDKLLLSSALATFSMVGAGYIIDTTFQPNVAHEVSLLQAEEARQIAIDIGWRPGEAAANMYAGLGMGARGEYIKALEAGHGAITVASAVGHQLWYAGGHTVLGRVYLDVLMPSLAQQHLETGLRIGQEINATFVTYSNLSSLVLTHIFQGNLEAAEALITPLLLERRLLTKSRWSQVERSVVCAYAELLFVQGKFAESLKLVEQLIQTAFYGTDETQVIPRLWHLRGRLLTETNELEAAQNNLERALHAATMQDVPPVIWRVHNSLARLSRKMGNPAAAQENLAAAEIIIQQLAQQLEEAPARENFLRSARMMLAEQKI